MRRTVVLVIGCVFFLCLLGDATALKTLALCLAMGCAYALSRVGPKYFSAAKYPLIGLCLALCPALVFYRGLRASPAAGAAAVLLSFYGIAFFLVTIEEKGRKVGHEVIGLSLLYGASALNLFLTGRFGLMLPLSVSMLVFLFIIDRVRIIPFVAAYTAACLVFLAVTQKALLGPDLPLPDAHRYALFACAFLLLLMTFISFMKRTDFPAVLAFFGLLYVSVDILMSAGLRLSGVLLYQPLLGLVIAGPLMGMAMKGGKET